MSKAVDVHSGIRIYSCLIATGTPYDGTGSLPRTKFSRSTTESFKSYYYDYYLQVIYYY
eukprot:SAG31_NODE_330_length_17593_cov_4.817891_1_plen_59_part_00